MSQTVVMGGGSRPLPRSVESHVGVYRGYAKSRQDYDARRRRSVRSATTLDFMAILRSDICAYCKSARAERAQDVDHIVPLSLSGSDSWENMTASCAPCNRGRRELPLLEFLLRRRDAG
jgi:5-methylcytosine-specific restriction endonuclease McrA